MIRFVNFVLLLFVAGGLGQKPCSQKDGACMSKALIARYPQLIEGIDNAVETSDPISVDTISGNLPELTFQLKHAKFHGFKQCAIKKLMIESNTYDLQINCPKNVITAKYTISGKLLGKPIEGDGDLTANYENYVLKVKGRTEVIQGKDNKDHKHLIDHTMEDEVGKVVYDLTNLFGGDKKRGDEMIKYVNENWKDSTLFLRKPVMEAFVDKLLKNFDDYFAFVPFDDLYVES